MSTLKDFRLTILHSSMQSLNFERGHFSALACVTVSIYAFELLIGFRLYLGSERRALIPASHILPAHLSVGVAEYSYQL
jgi:hypothetical protein